MSKVFEDLLKWVNSEEGIKVLEVERQKLLFLDELSNKYIDKLHSMPLEKRSELIDKIISKYESDRPFCRKSN
jgi:DNA-directed RNA polymerase subunit F